MGEFKGKEGDIVAGVIQQGQKPYMVYVDLGTIEAIMPPEEQVPGEDYSHGKRIRVYVTAVNQGTKGGPMVTVSRTHPTLVRKLFALEVPEIAAGTVEIVQVAREAGHRTKIAVRAHEAGINAKGACIGELGQRVRAVQAELNEEKIDIVDYSADICEFVTQALSPAKVTSAYIINPGDPKATGEAKAVHVRALVPDYQLSLAIGKEGQNVRLAAKLTGAKIDVQPESILEGED
jgi:N utilization substance protein A